MSQTKQRLWNKWKDRTERKDFGKGNAMWKLALL